MQILTLTFPFRLEAYQLPHFRAAIAEIVGPEQHLFHNHDNRPEAPSAYKQGHPLIRYCRYRNRAQIVAFNEGADAVLQILLSKLPAELKFAEKRWPTSNYELKNRTHELELLDHTLPFGLVQWIALNKAYYESWKALEGDDSGRLQLLDRCITGQLRKAAMRIAPDLDRMAIEARIIRQDQVKRLKWHGAQLVGFQVVAEANLRLPYGFGLGRCSAFGFGNVVSPKVYQRSLQKPQLVEPSELMV